MSELTDALNDAAEAVAHALQVASNYIRPGVPDPPGTPVEASAAAVVDAPIPTNADAAVPVGGPNEPYQPPAPADETDPETTETTPAAPAAPTPPDTEGL